MKSFRCLPVPPPPLKLMPRSQAEGVGATWALTPTSWGLTAAGHCTATPESVCRMGLGASHPHACLTGSQDRHGVFPPSHSDAHRGLSRPRTSLPCSSPSLFFNTHDSGRASCRSSIQLAIASFWTGNDPGIFYLLHPPIPPPIKLIFSKTKIRSRYILSQTLQWLQGASMGSVNLNWGKKNHIFIFATLKLQFPFYTWGKRSRVISAVTCGCHQKNALIFSFHIILAMDISK